MAVIAQLLICLSFAFLPHAFPFSIASLPGGGGGRRHHNHHYSRRAFHNVPSICSHTDHKAICAYAAASSPSNGKKRTLDAASLFAIHIRMATDQTKAAKVAAAARFAASRSSFKGTSPIMAKQALEICITEYDDALDALASGSDAVVNAKDAGTANSMLSAAITYYTTCDDAFDEIEVANPFARQNRFLRYMVSNAISFGQLILSSHDPN